jgi:hypothetical protein
MRLTRVSTEVLLHGPTTIEQISVEVTRDDPTSNTLIVDFHPPSILFNPRRTAVRVADIAGVPFARMPEAVEQTFVSSRVQAHENALQRVFPAQRSLRKVIKLPCSVDYNFCRPDDYGRDNTAEGITIATYIYDDPTFRANQQFVWILHIEMTSTERPMATPSKPAATRHFHQFA